MKSVPVFEAKNRFSELLHAVELGEEVIITRHGRPVARLVASTSPESRSAQQQAVSHAMGRLRALGQALTLGDSLENAIEEGRD